MKNTSLTILIIICAACTATQVSAQKIGSCKMFLEDKIVMEATVEDAIKWCELAPPTVQCDDGKIYKLGSFHITYLTLKPFMSQDFGIGEGGFPIKARNAVKNGKAGDTIILKNATYTNQEGITDTLPMISVKFR